MTRAAVKITVPPNPDADPNSASDLDLFGGTVELDNTQAEHIRRIAEGIQAAGLTELYANGAVVVCAADVKPEPIKWLWPGRIALGKVTLLVGDPGLGKSLVTVALAAHVSRGTAWPVDHAQCPSGKVLILSAEDDPADTIRPRLDAAGADPSRVHLLKAVRGIDVKTGETQTRMFSLKRDLETLSAELERLRDVRLVVVDPVSAYLDGTDSHTNADVRALLAPLAELAARHQAAIVAVSHLNKGGQQSALYRVTGSLAFVAAARAVYAVLKDPQDPQRRLILPVKNNLAPDNAGVAYAIGAAANGAPVVEWEPNPVTITAEEALAPAEADEEHTERKEAADWLREVLADGPRRVKELMQDARAYGFSDRTLQRARRVIGAVVEREGFGGHCRWALSIPANPAHSLHTRQPPGAGKNDENGGENGEAWEGDL